MRGEHPVLQRVIGVFAGRAGEAGEPVQLAVMATEQLGECVPVAGHVGGEQISVASLARVGSPEPHRRTVTNRCGAGTSPAPSVRRRLEP